MGVVLLEEILRSGVGALILDPKGDMGNLALCFPDTAPADFEPWVDDAEAAREGLTRDELAARTAERWRKGLAGSGIDAAAMRRYRDSVDFKLFTPGSTAGTPLDILGDLSAPAAASWDEDAEALREEIEGLVSGLLVLADIDADPLTSREHILLSNLVEHAWRSGTDLDLATLLTQIQTPPMRRLGVFEMEAFYPAKDRMALAMRLNGLVASPSFASWLEGEPLDIGSLLRAPDGRPRASIMYLAHLSETERQFVVTLLLSRIVTWMRRQAGTSDLRAVVYVDEVFGLAPPTAEPPSKKPMLTIFKQARAHGVGMVVATQNPVDLDYKLMSNAGTWMVGRLQTERDKARIMEALRSASGDVDVAEWDARIGALGKRQFLLQSTGPRTRGSSRRGGRCRSCAAPSRAPRSSGWRVAPAHAGREGAPAAPSPPPEPDAGRGREPGPADHRVGRAGGLAGPGGALGDGGGRGHRREEAGGGRRHARAPPLRRRQAELRQEEEWEAVLFPLDATPRAEEARVVDYDDRDFRDEAPDGATYVVPGAAVQKSELFRDLRKDLEEFLYRSRTVTLLRNEALKLFSRVGETEEAFRARCLEAAEDEADEEAAKLRERYEKRLDTVRRRKEDAERRVRELEVDVGQRKQQEVIAGAGALLSMFLGGRRRVSGLSGAASRRSQTRRTQERLQTAAEKMEDYDESIHELEDELAEEIQEVWDTWKGAADAVEPFEVPLEKSDIHVDEIVLFWAPRR